MNSVRFGQCFVIEYPDTAKLYGQKERTPVKIKQGPPGMATMNLWDPSIPGGNGILNAYFPDSPEPEKPAPCHIFFDPVDLPSNPLYQERDPKGDACVLTGPEMKTFRQLYTRAHQFYDKHCSRWQIQGFNTVFSRFMEGGLRDKARELAHKYAPLPGNNDDKADAFQHEFKSWFEQQCHNILENNPPAQPPSDEVYESPERFWDIITAPLE